jgi:hypothetical protein
MNRKTTSVAIAAVISTGLIVGTALLMLLASALADPPGGTSGRQKPSPPATNSGGK